MLHIHVLFVAIVKLHQYDEQKVLCPTWLMFPLVIMIMITIILARSNETIHNDSTTVIPLLILASMK